MAPGNGRSRGGGGASRRAGSRPQTPARPGGAAASAHGTPRAGASLGSLPYSRRSLLALASLASLGLVLGVIVLSSIFGGTGEAGEGKAGLAPGSTDRADLGAAPGAPPGFGNEGTTTSDDADGRAGGETEQKRPQEKDPEPDGPARDPRPSREEAKAPPSQAGPERAGEARPAPPEERAPEPAAEPPAEAPAPQAEAPPKPEEREDAPPAPQAEEPAAEEADQYAAEPDQYAGEEEVAQQEEEAPPPPADLGGVEEAGAPAVPEDKTLTLTVPKMDRLGGVPVKDAKGDDAAALDAGVIHIAGTGFPWDPEANVYMAGHRLGYINTGSFLVFYDLDKLREGDEVRLADAEGREYRYRVYDVFTVAPEEADVMQPVEGKNIVTLQTCTLPDYTRRLIVRAEKVA